MFEVKFKFSHFIVQAGSRSVQYAALRVAATHRGQAHQPLEHCTQLLEKRIETGVGLFLAVENDNLNIQ